MRFPNVSSFSIYNFSFIISINSLIPSDAPFAITFIGRLKPAVFGLGSMRNISALRGAYMERLAAGYTCKDVPIISRISAVCTNSIAGSIIGTASLKKTINGRHFPPSGATSLPVISGFGNVFLSTMRFSFFIEQTFVNSPCRWIILLLPALS